MISEQTVTQPPVLVVREATPADLDTVVGLIRLANDHPLDCGRVADYLHRLDPSATRAWLAFAGERPVGLTRVHFRTACRNGETCRAAYWMNLFIHPDVRKSMIHLYPRLVLTMINGARSLGFDVLYAGIRRQDVADGHLKLGFQKVDELPVLAKPLRPVQILIKQRRLPALIGVPARPIDWLYGFYLAARRRRPTADYAVEEIPWDSPRLEQVAGLWDPPGDVRMRQRWSATELRQRYATSVEGAGYTLLGVRHQEQFVSAAIVRIAERDPALRLGVIMDAAHAPEHLSTLRYALAEAERRFVQLGCDAVLFLDGVGDDVGRLMKQSGFIKTSEKYVLMKCDLTKDSRGSTQDDRRGWRFAFGDHDAF